MHVQEAILLIGHGSRDPEGNREFEDFVRLVSERERDRERDKEREVRIAYAFLEFANPTIDEAIDRLAAEGATNIKAVPIILLAAGHVKIEIPHLLDEARRRHPQIRIEYGRHLGLHEEILTILHDCLRQAEGENSRRQDTTVLLVGRGSSDPDANGDLYKIARLLWERTGVENVETCFMGVTFPDFPAGIRRAAMMGSSRVIVLPYFLFTGILMKRMEVMLKNLSQEFPDVTFSLADYFGYHPKLVDIVRDRIREIAAGEARMNCDTCQYRLEALHDHHHDHDHHHHDHHHRDHDHHHHNGREHVHEK